MFSMHALCSRPICSRVYRIIAHFGACIYSSIAKKKKKMRLEKLLNMQVSLYDISVNFRAPIFTNRCMPPKERQYGYILAG